MSLSFDGVDDGVYSDAAQTWGNLVTLSAWFNAASMGESNLGAIITHGTSFRMNWCFNGGGNSNKLRLLVTRGSAATWDMTTGFPTLPGWKWAAVTYDGSVVANTPTLYVWNGSSYDVLTVGAGLTQVVAPSGGMSADNVDVAVGNRVGSAARTFDGLVGELAHWKRVLSPAEVAAVFAMGAPAVPDYFNYFPFDSGRNQPFGASGTTFTVTGASAAENPPTRPAGRRG